MKKILSLLLVLACLASLVVLPVSAAGLDKATIQKAVVETAYAYYRKGMNVQYDSQGLTHVGRFTAGISRISTCDSPEQAAHDYTLYTVCSDWCFDVYWDAFGYNVCKDGRSCTTEIMAATPTSDPTVLLKFSETTGDAHTKNRAEFISKAQSLLEPGDLIVSQTGSSGHAMLYIGDTNGDGRGEIMHSSGSKIDMNTGIDKLDNPWKDEDLDMEVGSVRIDDVYDYLFNPDLNSVSAAVSAGKLSDKNHNLTTDKYTEAIVLRPSNDPNFPKEMTPSAQSRLKYPGLDIDRSTDLHKYNSTQTGNEITVTVTLKNTSNAAMTGIPVTETVPQGAAIVEGSASNGGAISASGVAWTVNIPAKTEVKLTYKVKVTAARGAMVSLPGGTVDQIPTRDLSYIISGKPLANTADLTAYANGTNDFGLANVACDETNFANIFYESVLGIDLGIPAKMQDVMDALLTGLNVTNAYTTGGKMLTPKSADQLDETGKYLASMLVPEHLSGRSVHKPVDPFIMKPIDRTMEYTAEAYEPGDIFLCLKGTSYLQVNDPADVIVYVYLGNGRVAVSDGTTVKTMSFMDTIACVLQMNISVVLRPSLAFDDVNGKVVPFKFTDVKNNAWYYIYVKSLVTQKVINGMTETTFAPNGTLTYGQALKLITLAVGEKEQAAANGHWAGGYMALAKAKGWLMSDVNLDANITRLEFCRIAAKAAAVSQQPAANPFTDTADTSVLALYNAGVINGMTAVTFQPDGLLTRAQIAKIIWCLQAV